jgi:hypothetical protein
MERTEKTKMKKLLTTVVIALAVLALAPVAKADSACQSISVSNFSPAGPYGTICLTLSGGNINVDILMVPNWKLFGNKDAVGFAASGLSINTINSYGGSTFTAVASIGVMDGFGSFNSGLSDGVLGGGGGAAHLSFTISGSYGSVNDIINQVNANGNWVAFHVGDTTINTGFATTGTTQVPEPGTMILLGSGLLGLGLAALRRRLL